ncbi:mRNA interferase RelE/StbE [Metapseudomonas resinovorans]
MTYELEFLPSALKEWRKLGDTVRDQFKRKLKKRLQRPRVQGDALHGMPDCFKIKLRSAGYRLVYRVEEGANHCGGDQRRQTRTWFGL